ncbi:MAG TPA: cytochrome P450 [Thermoanaerobaculia bacterium]|nr:cytochrome P450 [Thermoanaerobaculia bacterium]
MSKEPSSRAPLPPGTMGLPLLGETLGALKNGFAFVEAGARRHGPIFKTSLFGRKTAVITGPEASALFIDSARVQRSGAMPPHIQTLFAGASLPLLDGQEHRDRKRLVLAAFTRDALASYLPVMQRLVGGSFEKWSARGEVRLVPEFKQLAIETIATTVMGISRGPVLDRLLADYEVVGGGFASLPNPLPGSAFTRARKALDRILAVFEGIIREHQAEPADDGLSRMLAAKTEGGRGITIEEAKMELHHIVVAGLIVWAWFVEAILQLGKHPEIRARLAAEAASGAGSWPLTLEALEKMPVLETVSMEVRRLAPVVFVGFGKARETFEFGGYTVPKGWAVLWGLRSSHLRPEIYTAPEEFDPARFAPPRSEQQRHPCAFVPNGAGPATGHKCAGYEYAPLLLQVFLAELCRGYDVVLQEPQDLERSWSRVPPEPREGLRAVVRKKNSTREASS